QETPTTDLCAQNQTAPRQQCRDRRGSELPRPLVAAGSAGCPGDHRSTVPNQQSVLQVHDRVHAAAAPRFLPSVQTATQPPQESLEKGPEPSQEQLQKE